MCHTILIEVKAVARDQIQTLDKVIPLTGDRQDFFVLNYFNKVMPLITGERIDSQKIPECKDVA